MFKRIDEKFMLEAFKAKCLSDAEVARYNKYPLLELPPEDVLPEDYHLIKDKVSKDDISAVDLHALPFRNLVLMAEDRDLNFETVMIIEHQTVYAPTFGSTDKVLVTFITKIREGLFDEFKYRYQWKDGEFTKYLPVRTISRIRNYNEEALKGIDAKADDIFRSVLAYCEFTIDSTKHAFVSQSTQTHRPLPNVVVGKKKRLLAKMDPNPRTVLYLNSIPAPGERFNKNESMTNVLARKAHRRTLRAPRFKNHPMYMVEKGVRVREVYKGDTVSTYQGRTYKYLPDNRELGN